MSSPNHATSDIEDAFSSNFPDYISTSPDYVPASSRKTFSESSNDSFALELLPPKKQERDRSSSSTSALPQEFEIGESSRLRKGRVIIQQDFNNLETELQETRVQVAKLQRKQLGQNNKIALARFKIADLEKSLRKSKLVTKQIR
nr:hypothetical protein [Tanacetum cinerariifolium]